MIRFPGSDNEFYEDIGHVVLGVLPIDLLLWSREWTKVKLPWPLRGQYPPGRTFLAVPVDNRWWPADHAVLVAPLDRVRDVGVDTLGYAIGQTIRFGVMLGLLIWKW